MRKQPLPLSNVDSRPGIGCGWVFPRLLAWAGTGGLRPQPVIESTVLGEIGPLRQTGIARCAFTSPRQKLVAISRTPGS